METPDTPQTSQEKNLNSNNNQTSSRKRPYQDNQPNQHQTDDETQMNLEQEIIELKKLVKKQTKKIRSLEKLAHKLSSETGKATDDIDELFELVNNMSEDVYTTNIETNNGTQSTHYSMAENSGSDADYNPDEDELDNETNISSQRAALSKFTQKLNDTMQKYQSYAGTQMATKQPPVKKTRFSARIATKKSKNNN